ncbi:MAG: hypothetical protein J6A75_01455 [Lachnospiraceae bacterium]|nr:hypothetical protein [Lachnospiraceae bacterium]
MKNSRMKVTAVLLATAFMLSGCGEELYVLTPEEEAAVVTYAAHTVAKYNTYQKDGEVFVLQEVLNDEEVEESEETEEMELEAVQETEKAAEIETPEENEPKETETEETETESKPADSEETETESTEAKTTETEMLAEQETAATLTEALDLGVVEAEYIGHSLCTTYQQSEYYTVDADLGKQLLVLNVNLKNQVNQALHIDILTMRPEFRAVINGTEVVPAQMTILLNDLSTYQADIAASAVNETVLLFQIPQDMTEISDLQLEIDMNGKNFTVNL